MTAIVSKVQKLSIKKGRHRNEYGIRRRINIRRIIEVYNTEGKTAAYDLMRSCYEIKNPTCVMKRMKADKSLGYNYDTDRFESDSRKEDDIFLNLEMLCENKIETSDRSEGAINRNDRIKAMENMVHSLISDRLLELSKYVLLDPIGKRILIDKSSMSD